MCREYLGNHIGVIHQAHYLTKLSLMLRWVQDLELVEERPIGPSLIAEESAEHVAHERVSFALSHNASNLLTFLSGEPPLSTRIGRSKLSMRKKPAQARSKATVDAIIEAAARILSSNGWAGFTTNKVAAAAGVSIGSYYQYFPDKHSLIEAIRTRHLDDCLSTLKIAVEGEKPLSVFVEQLVDGIIAIHSVNPGLHRVLLDEAPSFDSFRDPNSAFEKEYLSCYSAAVVKYRRSKERSKDETVGMIISDAIDGVVHNAARRGTLQAAEVRNELVKMITSYLWGLGSVGST
jgi:AcrR family transcriptional regulator